MSAIIVETEYGSDPYYPTSTTDDVRRLKPFRERYRKYKRGHLHYFHPHKLDDPGAPDLLLLAPWELPGMPRDEQGKALGKCFLVSASAHRFSTVKKTTKGCWRSCHDRVLSGWGIAGDGDVPRRQLFIALKRTFYYVLGANLRPLALSRNIEAYRWIMNVYSLLDEEDCAEQAYVMCHCHVFQSKSVDYDPKPECTYGLPRCQDLEEHEHEQRPSTMFTITDGDRTQRDNHKPHVWQRFTKIYDYTSTGELVTLAICDHCCKIMTDDLFTHTCPCSHAHMKLQDTHRSHELSAAEGSSFRMEDIYIGLDALERIVDGSEKPSNLKFMLLQLITKFFSDELKLGHGGCGVVYKGILRNRIIAVKRLSNSRTIEDRMFNQEVQSLMRVKHQNIVQFLGYCSHTEEQAVEFSGILVMAQLRERLLCFEYINNGSLRDILTDELRGLDWHTRYQIIKGICEGLHHLHNENHIIHMDLKPSNILLDDQMVPKIIDFGLSRLDDKSRTMAVERLITLGYCAPEYQDHGKMSPKSDIYSLGIIVKELVTGSKEKPIVPKVFRRWKHRWNKSANTTPPLLWYKQVSKCLELATRCTHTNPTNRPRIWDIICELNKVDSGSDVSDATEWLELDGIIGVEPLEIHLPFQLNKKLSCSIELSNNETNGYDFAFMISTTSLRPYCIDPDRGIVPLGSKCKITITLQELERAPPHDYCRDEFSVQSTRVFGNHASSSKDMDITQDVFNEEPGKVVDNVELIVVLDVPPSSTSEQGPRHM